MPRIFIESVKTTRHWCYLPGSVPFGAVISLDSKFMFAFRNLLGFSQRNASVVIQFYPWFKFYFLLLQTHYHILPYPKTKEKKI